MTCTSRVLIVVTLALASIDAHAHGSVKGLGSFFSGVVHPLLEPAQLIGLVTMALLLGPRLESSRPADLCFALASVAGGIGVAFGANIDTDTVLLCCAAFVGLAVVVAQPLPRWVYSVAGVIMGFGIGIGSRPEATPGFGVWATLAGSCLGAPVWMLNLAALVQAMRKPWMQVLVRVFGSWATECSILVLSLVLTGRPLGSMTGAPLPEGKSAPLDVRRN